MSCKPEKAGATVIHPPCPLQHLHQTLALLAKPRGHILLPSHVGKRLDANRLRETTDRPFTKAAAQSFRSFRPGDGKAKPDPGEPIGLAERPQHHDI